MMAFSVSSSTARVALIETPITFPPASQSRRTLPTGWQREQQPLAKRFLLVYARAMTRQEQIEQSWARAQRSRRIWLTRQTEDELKWLASQDDPFETREGLVERLIEAEVERRRQTQTRLSPRDLPSIGEDEPKDRHS